MAATGDIGTAVLVHGPAPKQQHDDERCHSTPDEYPAHSTRVHPLKATAAAVECIGYRAAGKIGYGSSLDSASWPGDWEPRVGKNMDDIR